MDVLRTSYRRAESLGPRRPLFVGKRGNPMSKKWAEHNWAPCLQKLEITHRKFYATRHTFITEMVEKGQNLKAIADYCGTSVAMIEKDYCARQGFNLDHYQTPSRANYQKFRAMETHKTRLDARVCLKRSHKNRTVFERAVPTGENLSISVLSINAI